MNADDMPRLSESYLERPQRLLKELKPGEQTVLITMLTVQVDEELHVWIDGDSPVKSGLPITRMTLQAERTEDGFILWLDKATKFKPDKLTRGANWLPVVEFRDASGELE